MKKKTVTIHRLATVAALSWIFALGALAQTSTLPAVPTTPEASTLAEGSSNPDRVEANYSVTGTFTAQRRPRVTVLNFDDNNTEAQNARYGAAVEAMLVTFLRRKSQFVVVERQKLGGLLEERQRIGKGMVQVDSDNTAAQELLEKLDAYILGSITLLDVPTEVRTAETQRPNNDGKDSQPATEPNPQRQRQRISGPRIEVDAKLLARFDGRIIAAAQRSGPVVCLRSIVERLGIALEQEFLRPYYGKLKVRIDEPESVRVFLTPILLDDALDEEKPPVERSSTVGIGAEQDLVEPWITEPTAYTIENLLSGWYSLRLERPGYESLPVGATSWEAHQLNGRTEVFERREGLPLNLVDTTKSDFVVQVGPLGVDVLDSKERSFTFRKKGGSVKVGIRRQYLDDDFSRVPERVILAGKQGLSINQTKGPEEYSDDLECDLFNESPVVLQGYGKTFVAPGQSFDFDAFKGGQLVIEDYKGEMIPEGQYHLTAWEPRYESFDSDIAIRDQDLEKTIKTSLPRMIESLEIRTTGSKSTTKALLEGRETKARIEVPLEFEGRSVQPALPVDIYKVTTSVAGLSSWTNQVDLLPIAPFPPKVDPKSDSVPLMLLDSTVDGEVGKTYSLLIKTRLSVAGRLGVLSQPPNPQAADLFVDRQALTLLNRLLYGHDDRPQPSESKKAQEKAANTSRGNRVLLKGINSAPPTPAVDATEVLAGNFVNELVASQENREATSDPEAVRRQLVESLKVLDLLVLDNRDMVALRKSPEDAAIVERFVRNGGSIFAFVSDTGDYSRIVGAPLAIKNAGKPTDRFDLAPGAFPRLLPAFKKRIKVKSKRPLPELFKPLTLDGWRVIAFTKNNQKEPRIIERGERGQGGYVAIWLDEPSSFQGRKGGTEPLIEKTRANIEERVIKWSRFLMYQRYDDTGQLKRQAEQALLN